MSANKVIESLDTLISTLETQAATMKSFHELHKVIAEAIMDLKDRMNVLESAVQGPLNKTLEKISTNAEEGSDEL